MSEVTLDPNDQDPMTKGQIKAVAEWLSELHSHGLYAEELLDELQPFGITYKRKSKMLYAEDGRKVHAPVYPTAKHKKDMIARGLGGTIKEGDWNGITGWDLSVALCKLFDIKFEEKIGRGSQFYNCIEALQRASGGEGKDGK